MSAFARAMKPWTLNAVHQNMEEVYTWACLTYSHYRLRLMALSGTERFTERLAWTTTPVTARALWRSSVWWKVKCSRESSWLFLQFSCRWLQMYYRSSISIYWISFRRKKERKKKVPHIFKCFYGSSFFSWNAVVISIISFLFHFVKEIRSYFFVFQLWYWDDVSLFKRDSF